MSDSENDPLRGLLGHFALGPAWARTTEQPQTAPKIDARRDDRPPRRDDRPPGPREGRDQRDGRPPFRGGPGGGGNRNSQDRRDGPPRQEEIGPAPGVRVTVIPDPAAVGLIGKEIHQVARVYPLFDVAQILLAERSRCRVIFEVEASRPPLILGKLDESLFLTREEANRHLWHSDLRKELLDEETIESDPPTGNFQSVARCGMSGEWLGPPNFHSYQTNLRRLHRERFAHLPFEMYASKVRTERGEEAVNAWLETTKKKTRWRLKGVAEEAPWIEDRSEAERALATGAFDKAFAEVRKAELPASISGSAISPALTASLRGAGGHARNHPAILIPAVCRALEAEHLPVFKRQGKLHTGPARPHALAADAVLAERPGRMVDWIRANKPAKLEGLWQAVLPEGSTAPPGEYAADLFWLLQQGHILLYADDTLVVQEIREPAPPQEPKKKKEKRAKPAAPPVAEFPSAEELLAENIAPEESDELAIAEEFPASVTESTEEPTVDLVSPDAEPAAESTPTKEEIETNPPGDEHQEISPTVEPTTEAEPAPEAVLPAEPEIIEESTGALNAPPEPIAENNTAGEPLDILTDEPPLGFKEPEKSAGDSKSGD